jgi:hypothetical protein
LKPSGRNQCVLNDKTDFWAGQLTNCCQQVTQRIEAWKSSRTPDQMASDAQLTWEANVVQYVDHVYQQTKNRKDSKAHHYEPPRPLAPTVPLFGPKFLPPTFRHIQRRHSAPSYDPAQAYLKPIHIIHPFYYPQIAQCPECQSKDILWEGWTSTGARRVHGISQEETALGFQLRCEACFRQAKQKKGKPYCFATTNTTFWAKREHWNMPRTSGVPMLVTVTPELTAAQGTYHVSSSGVG